MYAEDFLGTYSDGVAIQPLYIVLTPAVSMNQIALKMLLGDRAKYVGLIFAIAFSTLLMSQQVSIFVGIMSRAAGQVRDMKQADVWVMHPEMSYIEEIKPMSDRELLRTRGVEGVEWALPLYKGMASARVMGKELQQAIIMGVDDATLMGQPGGGMLVGKWSDLRQPDAVIIDRAGFEFIWPGQPYRIGDVLEANDRRVVIVGVADANPPFMAFPVLYTQYGNALEISPGERNRMSFVLAKAKAGISPEELAERITKSTGMQALTSQQFAWRSINHILTHTGIAINFGITVMLGFIVGAVVAGQTFYIFVIENLKQFGALKAIGVSNGQIMRMVLLQAALAGFVGFSIGIGLCAMFFYSTRDVTALRGFYLPWQVIMMSLAAVVVIVLAAIFTSLRKVFKLDPAIVFRG